MSLANLRFSVLLIVVVALLASTSTRNANAAEQEIVSYRLKKWKTVHFDDAKRADAHHKTVKKLGCEVKKDSHGDHIDVAYRCPKWRSIALNTHKSAHEWQKWLKASGFETKHEH